MTTKEKCALGVVGVTGASLAAWKGLFPWLKHDIRTIRSSRKVMNLIVRDITNQRFVIDEFEESTKRRPNHPFLIFEDKAYSYDFVNQMANRVANLALTWNLKLGDVVAMMIENEPAFVWTFLGLLKIGLTAAFINYHLHAEPLAHTINASDAKVLIIGDGEEFLESVEEIVHQIPDIPKYIQGREQHDLPPGYIAMDECLRKSLPVPVCKSLRSGVKASTNVCYIFTSGTTGLPKPAIINNARATGGTKSYQWFDFNENDIAYIVTPLYHSAATCLSFFNVIDVGATLVLRRKFSVRHYWEDCRKYNVTVMQYIGEMCRYLLRAPADDLDGVHKIRVAFGNGLRQDIWQAFQTRFKIPKIIEFFGATEATAIFINICDRVGAVGRLSPIMSLYNSSRGIGNYLVKYDPIEDDLVRDRNGHCIQIKPGEEGLLISSIPPHHSGFYKASKATNEKKVIRNAFKDGDAYFSFGDLIYLDKDYFMYFRDRVGDTFRWKSENVSTREVGDVLSRLEFIQDTNVYGVIIPGSDGRAGMAAIMLKHHQEVTSEMLQKIFDHCHHSLPSYARPLFLRFVPEFETTQTMKHRKLELVKEGFDPEKVSDPLFFLDEHQKKYVQLDKPQFRVVLSSKL